MLYFSKPGPTRREMHNNKKVSTPKIPITRRKSRIGVLCPEETMSFTFHFYFVLPRLLNHAQHLSAISDAIAPPLFCLQVLYFTM